MANEWMFPDPKNASVSTTESVLAGGPIVTVRHDAEGRWVFGGLARSGRDDAVYVELGEFVERFPWVAQFADLPVGATASREHVMAPWQRDQG